VANVALAVGSIPRRMMWVPLISKQSRHRGVGSKKHRTARAAVAAGRFSLGSALRSEERDPPGSTITGAEIDSDPVDKHDPTLVVGDGRLVVPQECAQVTQEGR